MKKNNKYTEDIDSDPKIQYNAAIKRAEILINAARWDDAKQELCKVLATDSESVIAHYYMSVCYNNLGELREAKKEARLAISLSPDYANAYLSLANIALKKKRYSEGLKAIKTALELDPINAIFFVTKSALLINSSNPIEGLEAVEKALRLDPTNETARSNRTIALINLGRHDEADAQANTILSDSPDSPLAWYQKGAQLFMSGNLDGARKAALESEGRNSERLLLEIMSAQRGFLSLFWRLNLWLPKQPPFWIGMIITVITILMGVCIYMIEEYPTPSPFFLLLPILWLILFIYIAFARQIFKLAICKGWIK
jgi:tetratricopeptide (TPR) repeat protein